MRGFAATIIRSFASALFLMALAVPLGGTEKYWIAHEAELIVVGTLRPGIGYPSLGGWYETGTISVDEVLYGQRPPTQIHYRFTAGPCALNWWQRWMSPHFIERFTAKSLWLLRSVDKHTWEPANLCDSGCRYLSQRAEFERYIHLYKH
jgi:hypothetical protein